MFLSLMVSSEPLRIFISYSRKDGSVLAQRLRSDLAKQGFNAWLDTQRIAGGASWTKKIEAALDETEYILALMTSGSYVSEICRAEQLRGLRKGKCVIPLKAQRDADVPLHLEGENYRDFTADSSYGQAFEQLLRDLRTRAGIPLKPEFHATSYDTVPPLPVNFVERPNELATLRDALIGDDGGRHIALYALQGMGGIGKTVLAQSLCQDEVVQEAFPDGVIWITIGKESTFDAMTRMREVGKALGDDLTHYDNELGAKHQYRTTVRKKAALIVIDDVWKTSDIEPLLAESPRSRFLFTTRDASIARFVGAREHRADLLDLTRSRELLALWANVSVAELPAAANEVIAECGRLPLALSVVGALLRGAAAEFWKDTLALLKKADLSAIQEQLPEGQESFFKAVEVSFQSLKPDMQERYRALAMLLEDMATPLSILEMLWNVSEAEARRISRHFVDRSLAQSEAAAESIRLHDLQMDYVRTQYPDKKALDLIHGAIRLSSHVIARDPVQFASQMIGRLLSYEDKSAVKEFTKRVADGARAVWLRPLQPTLHPPGTALIRTLSGHTKSVRGVAMTPDGQRAVSASRDQTLKVWDLSSGRALRTLTGHEDAVTAVAVTPDGQRAVSASWDRTLKVWDLSSGRELRSLKGHKGSVNAVAMTPDGQCAVSASGDQTLKVWNLSSGRELRTLKGHTGFVTAVAVTPDGQSVVSASRDQTLKVWDLGSGVELQTLKGHTSLVSAVAVTPDGQCAVSASNDKTLTVWDLASGCELRTLIGHASFVTAVAVTPDGQRAVSVSHDESLKVWDLASGRELRTLTGHKGFLRAVAVTPDGQRAVSTSADKTLKVWDLGSEHELRTVAGHTGYVRGVAVTPDGQRAVSASTDRTLKVWNLLSGHELRNLKGHKGSVNAVAVTPDGQRVVSASTDKTLKVWDLASGRELGILTGHTDLVDAVAVTPDGQCAVSASTDKTLKVWDLASGRELRTLTGHTDPVTAVAVTPDGQRAVSASRDQTLKVWDLASGRELQTLAGHTSFVTAVAVTPDGQRAVSASEDETLKVWDLASGRELQTLAGHASFVNAVAVTPDGKRAVSASEDETLKVWEVATDRVLATFTCDSRALCCAFSETLKLILVGDAGGYLHVLRLEAPKSKD